MDAFEPKKLPTEGGKKLHNTGVSKSGFVPFINAISSNQKEESDIHCQDDVHVDSAPSKVDVVEEEGVIKRIVVTCSCGKVTSIDCFYEE